ncbi:unnamed protein product [Amoebophrya sp. A120]|nr:unnamed protein product [Amoebophrya sp. A120]|eukprot:GSA120T00006959001.1
MTDFRPGVLIHNFNEDQFGKELVAKGKMTYPTPTSIAQSAFRDPREFAQSMQAKTGGSKTTTAPASGNVSSAEEEILRELEKEPLIRYNGMDANLLFGHSGDMSTTKGLKQKAYITSTQYFYQAPAVASVDGVKTNLTVEKFYEGSHPIEVSKDLHSVIAEKTKNGWNYDKNPYTSIYKKEMGKADPTVGLETNRIPRVKGEFTRKMDAVCIKRTV